MSRTGLDAATLARLLRATGDGRMKWVWVQASVILDVADMLDEVERLRSVVSDGAANARELRAENDKLRKLCSDIWNCARLLHANKHIEGMRISDKFREECERAFAELGVEVDK